MSLPILGQDSAPVSRRPGRLRAAVLLAVHALIALHIAIWWHTGRALAPLEPSEAMELSKHGIVNAGAIFFLVAALGTAIFGRFFCGWGCHILALQDLCGWMMRRVGLRPRPLRSRALLWVPTLAFAYMFLWPLVYRGWIADPILEVRGVQLYTSDFWATFPPLGIALTTFLVCGFAAVYFLGNKGFCAYACPYGALFGAADRLAPLRIRVDTSCTGCARCTAVCTSDVLVHREVAEHGAVVSSACMKCLDCVAACPEGALRLGWGRPALFLGRDVEPGSRPRLLAVREEWILVVAFVATFLTSRGLYGRVPFLLALGLSAVVASSALVAVRLVRGREARLPGLSLQRAGRLRPAGRVFLVISALGAVLLAHSAFIRSHEWRAERAWARGETEVFARHAGVAAEHGLLRRPDLYLAMAAASLERGDVAGWEARLDGAEAAGASPPALLTARAEGLRRQGHGRQAIGVYERLIDAAPDLEGTYSASASVWLELGDPEAASRVVERGLRNRGRRASAALLHLAGRLALQCGDSIAAEARFRRALQREPGYVPAQKDLTALLATAPRPRGDTEP